MFNTYYFFFCFSLIFMFLAVVSFHIQFGYVKDIKIILLVWRYKLWQWVKIIIRSLPLRVLYLPWVDNLRNESCTIGFILDTMIRLKVYQTLEFFLNHSDAFVCALTSWHNMNFSKAVKWILDYNDCLLYSGLILGNWKQVCMWVFDVVFWPL